MYYYQHYPNVSALIVPSSGRTLSSAQKVVKLFITKLIIKHIFHCIHALCWYVRGTIAALKKRGTKSSNDTAVGGGPR
jgi:hypothetical protein